MLKIHRVQPASASRAEQKLALRLALSARILSEEGHDDLNQGQVSARLPGQERFQIKQALCGFDEARPSDMLWAHVDPAADVPSMAPPELPLHQAVYEVRPDVNAVVHTHASSSLLFGATDLALRPIAHDGACFVGRIGRFDGTSHTVLDLATGRAVAASLGHNDALFLRNHGVLIVGRSVRAATVLALTLERACALQLRAAATGLTFSEASAVDVARKQAFIYGEASLKAFWDYCVRRARRSQPDIAEWAA